MVKVLADKLILDLGGVGEAREAAEVEVMQAEGRGHSKRNQCRGATFGQDGLLRLRCGIRQISRNAV